MTDPMEESATLLFRLARAIAKHRAYDVTDGPYLGGFRGDEIIQMLADGRLVVIARERVAEICDILEAQRA